MEQETTTINELTLLENFFQQLIKIAFIENKKLGQTNIDYSKLYYSTSIPFKEDRVLNIRWVKLPTFQRENKQYYYAVFINDIDFWRMGEKTELYKQVIETIDRYDIDSYTVFQFGRYHGHNDPLINNLMKYFHIYVFNKVEVESDDLETVSRFVSDFLQKRINLMKNGGKIFGCIEKDVKRLQSFVDFLVSIRSFNCYRKKRSFVE